MSHRYEQNPNPSFLYVFSNSLTRLRFFLPLLCKEGRGEVELELEWTKRV